VRWLFQKYSRNPIQSSQSKTSQRSSRSTCLCRASFAYNRTQTPAEIGLFNDQGKKVGRYTQTIEAIIEGLHDVNEQLGLDWRAIRAGDGGEACCMIETARQKLFEARSVLVRSQGAIHDRIVGKRSLAAAERKGVAK
jgi:hypothetical protein